MTWVSIGSPATGWVPYPTVGRATMMPDPTTRPEVTATRDPRGNRATIRFRKVSRPRVAARTLAANPARASTGNLATHMLSGRPRMPGVVRPCPSIRAPTKTHPIARSTGAGSRTRAATTPVRMATTRAEAAMAETATTWKPGDSYTRSSWGTVRRMRVSAKGTARRSTRRAAPLAPTCRSSRRGPRMVLMAAIEESTFAAQALRAYPAFSAKRSVPHVVRYDGCVTTLKKVLLAAPRGYCAGVDRAVDVVERALRLYGKPVYVRKQIVHNLHVVRDLEGKGAVFVEEETEVPEGATVILSAHGVAPEVYENSRSRQLRVIDATCPLVTKVHVEVPDPDKVAYLSQTTLSVDETNEVIAVLRQRFPNIKAPPRDDICYATQNRQEAVKAMAGDADVVLVIGSDNSSNSNRLVEVSNWLGTKAYLIDDETEIDPAWLDGAEAVGVTSGASAPEWLVERGIERLRELG